MTRNHYPESQTIGTRYLGVLNTEIERPVACNDNDTMRHIGVVIAMLVSRMRAEGKLE